MFYNVSFISELQIVFSSITLHAREVTVALKSKTCLGQVISSKSKYQYSIFFLVVYFVFVKYRWSKDFIHVKLMWMHVWINSFETDFNKITHDTGNSPCRSRSCVLVAVFDKVCVVLRYAYPFHIAWWTYICHVIENCILSCIVYITSCMSLICRIIAPGQSYTFLQYSNSFILSYLALSCNLIWQNHYAIICF